MRTPRSAPPPILPAGLGVGALAGLVAWTNLATRSAMASLSEHPLSVTLFYFELRTSFSQEGHGILA